MPNVIDVKGFANDIWYSFSFRPTGTKTVWEPVTWFS